MKKFNQYILTHYPLIWNTRLHIMLPLLLLINGLFFFSGFDTHYTLQNLSEWRYSESSTLITIAILTTIILLIGWLLFYLRQNAFKNILPLSRAHLIKEFIIIFCVFSALCSFIVVYQLGKNYKLRAVTKSINIGKEQETIALAKNFLPFNADDFSVNRERTDNENKEFSYLNYNGNSYYRFSKDSIINAKAKKLLLTGNKTAVKNAINQYLLLCKKYSAAYNINVDEHVDEIFSTPNFKITGSTIGTYRDTYKGNYYIEKDTVDRVLEKAEEARDGIDKSAWFLWYYFAISLSVILFSFRVTDIKTWFIAIATMILLAIVVSLFVITCDWREKGIFSTMLLLALTSITIAIVNILSGSNKRVSGVCYLLFLWFLPAFIMVLYGLLYKVTRFSYYYDYYQKNTRNDFYDWLRDHVITCNVIGAAFTFIVLFLVLAPLIKKWQANTQE